MVILKCPGISQIIGVMSGEEIEKTREGKYTGGKELYNSTSKMGGHGCNRMALNRDSII